MLWLSAGQVTVRRSDSYNWITQWFEYCSTRLRRFLPKNRHFRHTQTHTLAHPHCPTGAPRPPRSVIITRLRLYKIACKDTQASQLVALTFPLLSSSSSLRLISQFFFSFRLATLSPPFAQPLSLVFMSIYSLFPATAFPHPIHFSLLFSPLHVPALPVSFADCIGETRIVLRSRRWLRFQNRVLQLTRYWRGRVMPGSDEVPSLWHWTWIWRDGGYTVGRDRPVLSSNRRSFVSLAGTYLFHFG